MAIEYSSSYNIKSPLKMIGSISNNKANVILTPSLNPSRQGREANPLPLDGAGWVGVK